MQHHRGLRCWCSCERTVRDWPSGGYLQQGSLGCYLRGLRCVWVCLVKAAAGLYARSGPGCCAADISPVTRGTPTHLPGQTCVCVRLRMVALSNGFVPCKFSPRIIHPQKAVS